MTIQGSINIALSSLNLLQQQSSMISTNIANASTAGYAQRDVIGGEFRSGGFGSGVVATEVRSLANQTAAYAANQASSARWPSASRWSRSCARTASNWASRPTARR